MLCTLALVIAWAGFELWLSPRARVESLLNQPGVQLHFGGVAADVQRRRYEDALVDIVLSDEDPRLRDRAADVLALLPGENGERKIRVALRGARSDFASAAPEASYAYSLVASLAEREQIADETLSLVWEIAEERGNTNSIKVGAILVLERWAAATDLDRLVQLYHTSTVPGFQDAVIRAAQTISGHEFFRDSTDEPFEVVRDRFEQWAENISGRKVAPPPPGHANGGTYGDAGD